MGMSRALAMESGSSFRHNFRRRPKGLASALYSTLRDAWVVVTIGKIFGQWPCFPAVNWETRVRVMAPSKGRGPVLALPMADKAKLVDSGPMGRPQRGLVVVCICVQVACSAPAFQP